MSNQDANFDTASSSSFRPHEDVSMTKSQSPLCGYEAAQKEAISSNGVFKLQTGLHPSSICRNAGTVPSGCIGGSVSRIAPKDVEQSNNYDCTKSLSEQVQPDKMSCWRESLLAAEANEAGSAIEDTRLIPGPPSLTGLNPPYV